MTTCDLAGPTRDAGRLTAAHELLLLALSVDAHTPGTRSLDRVIAGALLGELALRGLLRPAPAPVQLSPVALDALPHLRDAAPALAVVLEQLLATGEQYSAGAWVRLLALRGPELRGALLDELATAHMFGPSLRSPGRRRSSAIPALSPPHAAPRRLVRERLRAVVLHGETATAHDRLQLSLLCAGGLERALLSPDEWRRARPRLRELTKNEPIGNALRQPRADSALQNGAPNERFANVLGWFGLPIGVVDRLAFFWRG